MLWADLPLTSIESSGSNVVLFNLMMQHFQTPKSKTSDNFLLDIGVSDIDGEPGKETGQNVWMMQVRP